MNKFLSAEKSTGTEKGVGMILRVAKSILALVLGFSGGVLMFSFLQMPLHAEPNINFFVIVIAVWLALLVIVFIVAYVMKTLEFTLAGFVLPVILCWTYEYYSGPSMGWEPIFLVLNILPGVGMYGVMKWLAIMKDRKKLK